MTSQSLYFGFRICCLLCISSLATILAQPVVRVEQGLLMGKTVMFSEHEYINIDREIDVYEGVPFAEPPVRFEHPVKKAAWNGTYNATYVRPSCYQEALIVAKDGLELSEDCLYMNIYVPREISRIVVVIVVVSGIIISSRPTTPLPLQPPLSPQPPISNAAVMVWIHGGSFETGSGSNSEYNGEPLSAVGEVIHININYRLNTFGYLTTGDNVLPGNYGMMDQIEALKWIQANIHAFGGDKTKVTIFGQSAGSASVSYLMLSKLSRGLFNQAIMESGTALSPWAFQETSRGREIAFKMGAELGCTATDTTQLRQCLRDATTKELYDAAAASGFISAPCIDDYFLDDYPMNLIKRGEFQRTTLMLGTNADEATTTLLGLYPEYAISGNPPFISEEGFKSAVKSAIGNPLIEDSVYQHYLDWTIQDQDGLDFFRPFVDLSTDQAFAAPTDIVARAHAMAGDQVYSYQMTHVPTVSIWSILSLNINIVWLGSSHGEEISFVFGLPFMRVNNRLELSVPEKELSVKMMRFWTEFAKTGTPSMSSDPENEMYWPTFTVPVLNYKVLALNMTTDRALKADSMRFWNDLVPKLGIFTKELPEVEREWRTEFYIWKHEAMADWRDAFNAYKRTTCDAEGCK
ncbi:cholinesterase-like [Amphiura filiformis]|uniref:cholinesterase-like n=1 Tax=Amphiura filiformis TaxID=82378 RepID=UPI003B217A53